MGAHASPDRVRQGLMSGIAGVYYLDGKKAGEETGRMAEALAHRGPDARGAWRRDSIGLAHALLWTTPESLAEKQPLADSGGRLVITADARLDNRAELVRALGLEDSTALSDPHILLEAYRKWGGLCVDHLLGDFAFAIWDSARNALFCARDFFGMKPFYYFRSEKMFAFASEIKALLVLPGVPRRLNETMVADHLLWSAEDKEITFYKGVKRLEPASILEVRPGRFSKRVYWKLDPRREVRFKTDDEYAHAFRDIFEKAVDARMRSAFPVGSFLSGGLDSSSIACMARSLLLKRNGGTGLSTFSAIFDEVKQCDEREYGREVTELEGIRPHFIHSDKISPFFDIERLFYHTDEAHNCDLMMQWGGIYPEAKKEGIRVLLDGDGGDEVVSRGYPRLIELFSRGRWIEWARTVLPLSKNLGKPVKELAWCWTFRPLFPSWARRVWRGLRRRGRPAWSDDVLLNPDFSKRLGVHERAELFLGHEMKPIRNVREDDWRGLVSGVNNYTFEVMNRASSGHGIEHRYPFYDKRLVEFCLALPSEQKLHRGWTKVVLRRAMKGLLPEKIRWRPGKTYLSDNIAHGLKVFEKEKLEEMVVKDTARLAPYVDLAGLKKAHRSFVSQADYASTTLVWQIAMFNMWLKFTRLEP